MDEEAKNEFARKLKLDRLPESEREEALLRMSSIIFRGVMLRVVDLLGDAEQKELDRIITEHPQDTEAIFGFLSKKVEGFDTIVAEEIALFTGDAMDIADKMHR